MRVPATTRGMSYLTGYSLDPLNLVDFLTGLSGEFEQDPQPNGKTTVNAATEYTTKSGERLLLLPSSGLPKKRWRGGANRYSVEYIWPEAVENGGSPPLPEKISINLPRDGMVLQFILRKWKFGKPGMHDNLLMIPADYKTSRPFE